MADEVKDGADGEEAVLDAATTRTVHRIPMLTVRAGPRDGEAWIERLKEEYTALIQYISMNKEGDNDWFTLESDRTGNRCGLLWGLHLRLFAQASRARLC
jgi:ufm1-conjugating enzyme 1